MTKAFKLEEGRIIGVVNRTLLPELAAELGAAVGTYLGKGSIVAVARDYRRDCHTIKRAFTGGLMSAGVDILDMHAAPTSTLQFIVRRFGANGGISFTAAHYGLGQMSIRVLDATGNELDEDGSNEVMRIFNAKKFNRVETEDIGQIQSVSNAIEIYSQALNSFIRRKEISAAKFRIVLDCSLGPTSQLAPSIASGFDADVTTMNSYQISPKEVLPNPKSLQRISKTVVAITADIGIALDTEGVKFICFDNMGSIVPPEELSAIVIWNYIKNRQGRIILSKYFTHKYDKAFLELGAKVTRVEDSPGNIGRVMAQKRAVIGATDNGKLFNPMWGPESDGVLVFFMLLELMAQRKMKLTDLLVELDTHRSPSNEVPTNQQTITLPTMISQNLFMDELLKKAVEDNLIYRDTLIGFKIGYENGWAHFMCSPKNQVINLTCECSSENNVSKVTDLALELSRSIIRDNMHTE